jgi:hypothetical protein
VVAASQAGAWRNATGQSPACAQQVLPAPAQQKPLAQRPLTQSEGSSQATPSGRSRTHAALSQWAFPSQAASEAQVTGQGGSAWVVVPRQATDGYGPHSFDTTSTVQPWSLSTPVRVEHMLSTHSAVSCDPWHVVGKLHVGARV